MLASHSKNQDCQGLVLGEEKQACQEWSALEVTECPVEVSVCPGAVAGSLGLPS